MSCGRHHETDCSEVLGELWLFLDRECDVQRRDLLQKHLEECRPCLERYGIEEHLKILLARKCGGDQAPDEFKERLRASIRQTVLDAGLPAGAVEVTRTSQVTVQTTQTTQTTQSTAEPRED
ncbi:mycothiol system anti-sigma-R factor [Actinokineospora iranica]|uniref:Mycothiol system anti-sigma-R factor n=1 Tax=Actinokineospora iranica TaxID=1271860 RepID=A0A1G6SYN9_9PSEU|nr:mycothiol system anti-sigma-R factor [Actinokineospora iranica]SDD22080.1 mycothiol system anti-sigma-R factor [Actinokineospora iranica]